MDIHHPGIPAYRSSGIGAGFTRLIQKQDTSGPGRPDFIIQKRPCQNRYNPRYHSPFRAVYNQAHSS